MYQGIFKIEFSLTEIEICIQINNSFGKKDCIPCIFSY